MGTLYYQYCNCTPRAREKGSLWTSGRRVKRQARKTSGTGWGESLLRQDSPHCVPCAMCQPRGSSRILRGGLSTTPSQGGAEPRTLNQRGSLRGACPPSCTRRRVPPSRRRGATLSRGEPTVIHCRRAPFSVGKRGVRYPFVPKAGRCRRRWVSSTQSFESRSARVPR